jgi:rhamnogalacturonan acetylesterase
MRNYVRDVGELGAEPIILSLIPRNVWNEDGDEIRTSPDGYAAWARQVAEEEGVTFIPLNALLAARWTSMGKEVVTARLFPEEEYVHPNWAGAAAIAGVVAQALHRLDTPLKAYMLASPHVPSEPDITPEEHGAPGPQGMLPAWRTPRSQ